MLPLIKLETGKYQINGGFFGLRSDPDAKIYCTPDGFRAQIFYTNGNVSTIETTSFRAAYNFLVEKTVKPIFTSYCP
jgi:hypothetical protein